MTDEPESGWWRLARWSLRVHGVCLPLSVLVLVLLVGLAAASGMVARWVLTRRDLRHSLGWLSAGIALAYVVGQVAITAGQVGVAMLARVLAMGLLTPIWALWFAHHLHPGR